MLTHKQNTTQQQQHASVQSSNDKRLIGKQSRDREMLGVFRRFVLLGGVIGMSTAAKVDFAKLAQQAVPSLAGSSHKGQAGRIGIVGGSADYTGAPYFAAISALKVGADLVHIFCAREAAAVIKGYSPELIVHGVLDAENAADAVAPWLDRLHVLVIGPGLGRDHKIFETVKTIIELCEVRRLPLVIDADGLILLSENNDLFKGYSSPGVVLTPNQMEYNRLVPQSGFTNSSLAAYYGVNVSILKKGSEDELISMFPENNWTNSEFGSGRRCGGQGDILSGSIAVFWHWLLSKREKHPVTFMEQIKSSEDASVACYAASRLVRMCNERAFRKHGRSMLASDMIQHIHDAFEILYESNDQS